jgi:5-oxoprolinase (ATP-hydrolysing) subunit A
MRCVDLNADLGEEVTDDAALLEVVTSANVACGYHAGSAAIMASVCARAAELGVSVGAQVSYDDRENFGRVALDVEPDVLREQVADQVGVLSEIAVRAGVEVAYVKPHGALYHRVLDDELQARAVLGGSGGLAVLTMAGVLGTLAGDQGRTVWREGFPDRAHDGRGRLVDRSEPGAVLAGTPAIVGNALELAGSVDSLCLHGDTPGAVGHARAVKEALEAAGWTLRGL